MFWMFWGDVKQIYYFYIFLLLLKCFYKHGSVYMYHYTSDDDGCILKQDNSFKREKWGIGYIRSNFYIRKKMKWEKTIRWSTILTKDQFNLEQRNWIWQMVLAFFKEKGWGMLRKHSNGGIFYVTCYVFFLFFWSLKMMKHLAPSHHFKHVGKYSEIPFILVLLIDQNLLPHNHFKASWMFLLVAC